MADREVVGLIAASLAFGGVKVIQHSIDDVLNRLGREHPVAALVTATRARLRAQSRGFRHRWVNEAHLTDFLWAIRRTLLRYGSLEALYTSAADGERLTGHEQTAEWMRGISQCGGIGYGPLLSNPDGGSALKRIHLYLRWMVRRDEVDPGGWTRVSPTQLIVPVDRHMHRLGQAMGMTRRAQADRKTAQEITDAFRMICPEDPVRYDFCLTRLGIRGKRDEEKAFLDHWTKTGFPVKDRLPAHRNAGNRWPSR